MLTGIGDLKPTIIPLLAYTRGLTGICPDLNTQSRYTQMFPIVVVAGHERLSDVWGYAGRATYACQVQSERPDQEVHGGLHRAWDVEAHFRNASAHQT